MKFDITKRVELEYDGWEGCYLEFYQPTYSDLKKITTGETDEDKAENGLKLIVELFKGGFAMSDGIKVEVKKEDLKDLPIEIITKCFKTISGEIDPK